MNLNELIGAQLIAFHDKGFTVKMPGGKKRHFVYDEDYGDCCGYNELSTELFFSKKGGLAKHNPVITNVTWENHNIDEGNAITVTFYGVNNAIAKVESYSSSGSGWQYGACVTLRCIETKETKVLSKW